MGFTREHAVDSLQNTTSLEQATEYILTHPPPAPTSTAPTTSSVPQVLAGMDIEGGSDEEQILRAIAMSLGESMAVLQGVCADPCYVSDYMIMHLHFCSMWQGFVFRWRLSTITVLLELEYIPQEMCVYACTVVQFTV